MNRRGELTETSSEDDTPSENPKSSPRRGHQVNHLQAYHYDSHGSSNTKAMPRLNGQIDHFGVGKNIFCPQMSWDKLEAQYEISDVFAEGNFAQVRKATKKSSKVDFAIKVIPKEKVLKRAMIDNEISIMQSYGFQKNPIRERKKCFRKIVRIMRPLDVHSPGSRESIARNRFSKFDREHAFLNRLRFWSI